MSCIGRNYIERENQTRVRFKLSKFTNIKRTNVKNEYEKSFNAIVSNAKLGCL